MKDKAWHWAVSVGVWMGVGILAIVMLPILILVLPVLLIVGPIVVIPWLIAKAVAKKEQATWVDPIEPVTRANNEGTIR